MDYKVFLNALPVNVHRAVAESVCLFISMWRVFKISDCRKMMNRCLSVGCWNATGHTLQQPGEMVENVLQNRVLQGSRSWTSQLRLERSLESIIGGVRYRKSDLQLPFNYRLSSAVTVIYSCTALTPRSEKKNGTVFLAWAAAEHQWLLEL